MITSAFVIAWDGDDVVPRLGRLSSDVCLLRVRQRYIFCVRNATSGERGRYENAARALEIITEIRETVQS